MHVVNLPEPPYFAVVAPAVIRGAPKDYYASALRLIELAREQPGFLGIETCVQPGFSLAVSYWQSLDAIAQWSQHVEHVSAKHTAKEQWFSAYATRIARVERAY